MPTKLEFLLENRGVRTVATGTLTGRELIEVAQTLASDEDRLRRLEFGITDLTGVTDLKISVADVRIIADLHVRMAKIAPPAVLAVVAPQDVGFGMARMWEAFAEPTGWTTAVFRNLDEAQSWIEAKVSYSIR